MTSFSEWWSRVPLMSVLGVQKWGLHADLPSESCYHPGDHNKLEKWDKFLNRQVEQSVQGSASGKEHVMNHHKLVKHLCKEWPEGSPVHLAEHEPAKYPGDKEDKWGLSYSSKSVYSNAQKLTGHCPGQLAVGGLTWAGTFEQVTSWDPFPTQSFWDSMIVL